MRRLETPQYQFALREEAHIRGLFDRALRASRSEAPDAQAALHDGVCSFVRRARNEDHQVETIIVALKDILSVPDRPSRSLHGDEDAPPAVLLARRVIRWCIDEYYAEK